MDRCSVGKDKAAESEYSKSMKLFDITLGIGPSNPANWWILADSVSWSHVSLICSVAPQTRVTTALVLIDLGYVHLSFTLRAFVS